MGSGDCVAVGEVKEERIAETCLVAVAGDVVCVGVGTCSSECVSEWRSTVLLLHCDAELVGIIGMLRHNMRTR